MKKVVFSFLLVMLALCAVAEAPVLTMGTNAAFKPYEFYEGTEIVGIDAEIAAAICEKLGYQLEIIDMDFATLIPAVASGKIDFAMAGMTVTEERLQSVNFSVSYATGVQSIIVPVDGPIKDIDDLYAEGAAYTIGVQEGTTGDIYCTDDFGDENVLKFKTGPDAVAALAAGKIDCVVLDNNPAKAYIETFTRGIAAEYAKKGLRCNCVAPGSIDSGSLQKLIISTGSDVLRDVNASARFGTPEDVAAAVAFLCSDESRYINGAVLHVDGGYWLGL